MPAMKLHVNVVWFNLNLKLDKKNSVAEKAVCMDWLKRMSHVYPNWSVKFYLDILTPIFVISNTERKLSIMN